MNNNVNPTTNNDSNQKNSNTMPTGVNSQNVNNQPSITASVPSTSYNTNYSTGNSQVNSAIPNTSVAGVQTGVSNEPVLINTVVNDNNVTNVNMAGVNSGVSSTTNMVNTPSIGVNTNTGSTIPVNNTTNSSVTNDTSNVSGTSNINNSTDMNAIPGMKNTSIVDNIIAANEASQRKKVLKEVQIDYKPPSKLKYTMLILVFIAILLMVWYLPEISSYINTMKLGNKNIEEKITTGTLKCKMSRSSKNFDFDYEQDFAFKDNKLSKLYYTIKTRGDMNLDSVELDKMNNTCKNISIYAKQLKGITVSCELSQGIMTEEHVFDYAELDVDAVTATYTEAGGVYPEYYNGQDMDTLEKNKKAEGFTCQRIK